MLVRSAVQTWLRRESTVRCLKRCIIQRFAVAPKGMDSLHFFGPPLARRTDVGIKPARSWCAIVSDYNCTVIGLSCQ